MTTTSLPDGVANVDYGTERLTATGGDGNYVWGLASSSGPLTTGLRLAASGDITGTPMVGGTSNFTVEVASGDGKTAQQARSITVSEALVLQPGDLCSDHPASSIATFGDANLEAALRNGLGIGVQGDLTCALISGLRGLVSPSLGIVSLVGIQNLTGLTGLDLQNNSISDLSALSGLTSLTALELANNSIGDISALGGLTSLTFVGLDFNSISDIGALTGLTSLTGLGLRSNPNLSDIQPLLDNAGLGTGDIVDLSDTSVSCADVAALQAKGVSVFSDCP